MVFSSILSGRSHPQYVALLLWKNYANFRTGSLPAVAGHPEPSIGLALTYTPFQLSLPLRGTPRAYLRGTAAQVLCLREFPRPC